MNTSSDSSQPNPNALPSSNKNGEPFYKPKTPQTTLKPTASPKQGIGLSANIAMWVIVATLCWISLARYFPDQFSTTSHQLAHERIDRTIRDIEAQGLAASIAARGAASSARASAVCAASLAARDRNSKNCALDGQLFQQSGSFSGQLAGSHSGSTTEVAKLTLDSVKDRFEVLKEGNDRLFSVLAAMGALLVFLGFKGLDSFVAAKNKAEEAVEKAKLAQEQAEKSTEQLENFLEKINKIENRAELNVSQGFALRELATLMMASWKLQNNDSPLPPDGQRRYHHYLTDALYYLRIALNDQKYLDEVLILRAMGIQCNVYNRLGNPDKALEISEEMIRLYPEKDDSAYFNAACYCSLLGQRQNDSEVTDLKDYGAMALRYLRKAIVIEPENKTYASSDQDFSWLKIEKKDEFESLLK